MLFNLSLFVERKRIGSIFQNSKKIASMLNTKMMGVKVKKGLGTDMYMDQ